MIDLLMLVSTNLSAPIHCMSRRENMPPTISVEQYATNNIK